MDLVGIPYKDPASLALEMERGLQLFIIKFTTKKDMELFKILLLMQ